MDTDKKTLAPLNHSITERLALSNPMKKPGLVPSAVLVVITTSLAAALLATAQTKTQDATKQTDTLLALHQLELLMAHLDAKKDTEGIELLNDYQHALDGQQASAAIAMNIKLILQKLRDGRTQEVIDRQERRLASDAITLYGSYSEISPGVRDKLSLQTIGVVRDYFAKYPRTNQTALEKEGLSKAFALFDEKSRNKK